jgi:TRAP-type C4-dicarboxylate transport system permease small subunit
MTRILDHLVEAACAVVSVALAVTVFVQVFNRFVLQMPLAWSEDLAMLLFQWMVFLGAALGVKRMRHFGIELAVSQLPARARHTLALVVPLIMAVVAVIMVSQGITLLSLNLTRRYGTMNLSYTWSFLPIPVSGGLMLIYLLQLEVHRWRSTRERQS